MSAPLNWDPAYGPWLGTSSERREAASEGQTYERCVIRCVLECLPWIEKCEVEIDEDGASDPVAALLVVTVYHCYPEDVDLDLWVVPTVKRHFAPGVSMELRVDYVRGEQYDFAETAEFNQQSQTFSVRDLLHSLYPQV